MVEVSKGILVFNSAFIYPFQANSAKHRNEIIWQNNVFQRLAASYIIDQDTGLDVGDRRLLGLKKMVELGFSKSGRNVSDGIFK